MQASENLSHHFLFSKLSRELSTITEISNSIDSKAPTDNKSKSQRYLENHSDYSNTLSFKRSKNYTSKSTEKLKKPLKYLNFKRNSEKTLKKKLLNLNYFRTNVNSPSSRKHFSRDSKTQLFQFKQSKKHFEDLPVLKNFDLMYRKKRKVEIDLFRNIRENQSFRQKTLKKLDFPSLRNIKSEIKEDLINLEVRNLTQILLSQQRIH